MLMLGLMLMVVLKFGDSVGIECFLVIVLIVSYLGIKVLVLYCCMMLIRFVRLIILSVICVNRFLIWVLKYLVVEVVLMIRLLMLCLIVNCRLLFLLWFLIRVLFFI